MSDDTMNPVHKVYGDAFCLECHEHPHHTDCTYGQLKSSLISTLSDLAAARARVQELEAIDAASVAGVDACFRERPRTDGLDLVGPLRIAWWGGYDAADNSRQLSKVKVRLVEVERKFHIPATTGDEPSSLSRAELEARWHSQRISLFKIQDERATLRASCEAMRGALVGISNTGQQCWCSPPFAMLTNQNESSVHSEQCHKVQAALSLADVGKREEARRKVVEAANRLCKDAATVDGKHIVAVSKEILA